MSVPYFTVTAGAERCPAVCVHVRSNYKAENHLSWTEYLDPVGRAWASTAPQACWGLRHLGVRPQRVPQSSVLIPVTGATAGYLRDTSLCYSRYVRSHRFTAFI